jgi:hypothetical protein
MLNDERPEAHADDQLRTQNPEKFGLFIGFALFALGIALLALALAN